MIARLAVISAGLPVDLGLVPRINTRGGAKYEYATDAEGLFVLVLELRGDELTPYARIPLLPNGESPIGKEIENGQIFWRSFRFEIGERFCVVEVLDDTFWVWEVVVGSQGIGRYQMRCNHLFDHLPVDLIKTDPPRELQKFVPAITLGCRIVATKAPEEESFWQ